MRAEIVLEENFIKTNGDLSQVLLSIKFIIQSCKKWGSDGMPLCQNDNSFMFSNVLHKDYQAAFQRARCPTARQVILFHERTIAENLNY